MWKYLIANALGFFIMLSVLLFGNRRLQLSLAGAIFTVAVWALFQKGLDPLTWLFYVVYACVIYWGMVQFKRWSLGGSIAVDEELDRCFKKAGSTEVALEKKTREFDEIAQRTNALAYLYETIQEISKSLDRLEAFVVFGQALYDHFEFNDITLAFFDGENPDPHRPDETFRLEPSYFSGVFDRAAFLRDKNRALIRPDNFVKKIFEEAFRDKKPPFATYPMFMDGKIFAVLVLSGVTEQSFRSLSILIQRFISETRRIRLYQKIGTLAITDGLTGVYVRRHLMERLEGEFARSRKLGLKLSLLMIDVDHFKRFNDQHGHLVGDAVLKQVAETIAKNIREIDLVGRYGGEEFAVLLIETDESGAFFAAERIRRAVQEKNVRAYDEDLEATISIGCATLTGDLNEPGALVEAADEALYQAKKDGRNRVCFQRL